MDLKIATFNVENLFDRASLLNLNDHAIGDQYFARLAELQRELRRITYDKPRILALWRQMKRHVTVRETRGKLFDRNQTAVVANGYRDWEGSIEFKRAKLSDDAQKNTGKVIREVDADVMCLVEVESRPVLERFNREQLYGRYGFPVLFDGNDNRGIDVALLSKRPVGGIWTHVFDTRGTRRIFSRDCLEVQVFLPGGKTLWMLLNHFKSRGYGSSATNDARRRVQAVRVKEILQSKYDLRNDLVVVAGDLNDNPQNLPLRALLRMPHLHEVLSQVHPGLSDRWTYYYDHKEQIDYILVSDPLREALVDAGVERRGMYDLEGITKGAEKSWTSVSRYADSASDHGAVWASFRL